MIQPLVLMRLKTALINLGARRRGLVPIFGLIIVESSSGGGDAMLMIMLPVGVVMVIGEVVMTGSGEPVIRGMEVAMVMSPMSQTPGTYIQAAIQAMAGSTSPIPGRYTQAAIQAMTG